MTDAPCPIPPVPPAVLAVAGERHLRLAWANEIGGLTYEVTGRPGPAARSGPAAGLGPAARSGRAAAEAREEPGRIFVKWVPATSGVDLSAEVARLAWAGPYSPVPRVLDRGCDGDGSWMVTAGLAGDSAASPRWLADPARAVAAVGSGLRALHRA
ncbi:MAG: hypothetical protein ACRD0J_08765, partial [Acidimicrobiales bacterium]